MCPDHSWKRKEVCWHGRSAVSLRNFLEERDGSIIRACSACDEVRKIEERRVLSWAFIFCFTANLLQGRVLGCLVLVLSCLGRRDRLVTQYQVCTQGSPKLEDFHLGDLQMQSLENKVDGGIHHNKVLKVIMCFRGFPHSYPCCQCHQYES